MSELPVVPRAGSKIAVSDVEAIERRLAENVGQVKDLAQLNEWRDQALALEAYLRSKNLHGPMLGAQRRVEARIGELLGDAKVGRPNPHRDEVSHDQDRADFRILRHAFNGCELSDEEWRQSRRGLVALIRKRAGLTPKAPPPPAGTFSTVVVDPPWPMRKIERDVRPDQGPVLDYPVMSEAELLGLEIPAADDAHLYLWTTHRFLPLALKLTDAWGFRYQCLLTWRKNVGITPFSWMYSTEHVVFARRGSLDLLVNGRRLDFEAKVREHSRKPDEFYGLVRNVSPAPRVDMFARGKHEGFESWGNEVERFADAA